jgi:hypothetical protein
MHSNASHTSWQLLTPDIARADRGPVPFVLFLFPVCREGIEDVVLSKRRFTYEQQLSENPLNYDAWFDYVKLEESTGNLERIREVG